LIPSSRLFHSSAVTFNLRLTYNHPPGEKAPKRHAPGIKKAASEETA
jgi:hypothetical protein